MLCNGSNAVVETVFDKIGNALQFINAKFSAFASTCS